MCYCDDGDTPKLFEERTINARKAHVCYECGSQIDRGEKYVRIKGLWDEFETYKLCEFCHDASDLVKNWCFGELWETITGEGKLEEVGKNK